MDTFFKQDIIVTEMVQIWNGLYMPRYPFHTVRPHSGIVLTIDGARDYCFPDRTITARPGHILYLPKGSVYHLNDMSPCDCISFNFQTLHPLPAEPFLYSVENQMQTYTELFRSASRYFEKRPQGTEAKLRSLLYQVLYLLQSGYTPDYVPRDRAQRIGHAVEYIHLHYMNPGLSVEELAELCGISDVYFRRLFRQLYQVTPSQYIRHYRLRKAMELLESGMYRVGEVAGMVGYESEFYFSRTFRQQTGICPSHYGRKT